MVEPLPETSEAVDEFGPFEANLIGRLKQDAAQVQQLVPDCVGFSLASHQHGLTLTLVVTTDEIAALDGIPYLNGGPCVESVKAERVLEFNDSALLAETNWQLFAQATAAAGIASTLTLPILAGTQVAGSVSLYAATSHAFTGQHEALAEVFSAWAPGAVANADMSFSTRDTARQAPRLLGEEVRLDIAVGILMHASAISDATAREQLREAARQAGTTELAIAEALIAGNVNESHQFGD